MEIATHPLPFTIRPGLIKGYLFLGLLFILVSAILALPFVGAHAPLIDWIVVLLLWIYLGVAILQTASYQIVLLPEKLIYRRINLIKWRVSEELMYKDISAMEILKKVSGTGRTYNVNYLLCFYTSSSPLKFSIKQYKSKDIANLLAIIRDAKPDVQLNELVRERLERRRLR